MMTIVGMIKFCISMQGWAGEGGCVLNNFLKQFYNFLWGCFSCCAADKSFCAIEMALWARQEGQSCVAGAVCVSALRQKWGWGMVVCQEKQNDLSQVFQKSAFLPLWNTVCVRMCAHAHVHKVVVGRCFCVCL